MVEKFIKSFLSMSFSNIDMMRNDFRVCMVMGNLWGSMDKGGMCLPGI